MSLYEATLVVKEQSVGLSDHQSHICFGHERLQRQPPPFQSDEHAVRAIAGLSSHPRAAIYVELTEMKYVAMYMLSFVWGDRRMWMRELNTDLRDGISKGVGRER